MNRDKNHKYVFKEFLNFKGFSAVEPYIEDERGRINGYFEEYLQYGGFPELVNYEERIKIRTLQEYLDMVVYKDLVERYGIGKIQVMKDLIKLIVKNFSRRTSIRSLYNALSSGLSVSKNTVYEYFSYLEDIGFVIPVQKFGFSEKEKMKSIAKLYLIDTGFASVYGVEDKGLRMENLVATELLRRKYLYHPVTEICYWHDRSQKEVDFVIKEGFNVKELIQVCYDLEDLKTREREIKSLLKASEEMDCSNLKVITRDHEVIEEHVEYVPIWKWLLNTY